MFQIGQWLSRAWSLTTLLCCLWEDLPRVPNRHALPATEHGQHNSIAMSYNMLQYVAIMFSLFLLSYRLYTVFPNFGGAWSCINCGVGAKITTKEPSHLIRKVIPNRVASHWKSTMWWSPLLPSTITRLKTLLRAILIVSASDPSACPPQFTVVSIYLASIERLLASMKNSDVLTDMLLAFYLAELFTYSDQIFCHSSWHSIRHFSWCSGPVMPTWIWRRIFNLWTRIPS